MPNIASTLNSEISGLANREFRREVSAQGKASAIHRRHIAALKWQIADLQRQAAQLAKRSRAARTGRIDLRRRSRCSLNLAVAQWRSPQLKR